jgi:L-lactate dehydrogenase complex protein LldG
VSDRGDAERFCAALAAVEGDGVVCGSAGEAHDVVRRLCGGRPVVIDGHPDLAGLAAGLAVVDDPWEPQVGVTGVLAAVVDTGTLALDAAPDRPRSTSLVPPEHVALVPFSRLVATFAEAVALLDGLHPKPSNLQFITGPSRSGDIEMKLVRGVHGPGKVHVVLYPD